MAVTRLPVAPIRSVFQIIMAPVPPQYDVVVVGAGVIGLCTAYTMARKGLRVLLLEQVKILKKS